MVDHNGFWTPSQTKQGEHKNMVEVEFKIHLKFELISIYYENTKNIVWEFWTTQVDFKPLFHLWTTQF